jgi:hypothetical protein
MGKFLQAFNKQKIPSAFPHQHLPLFFLKSPGSVVAIWPIYAKTLSDLQEFPLRYIYYRVTNTRKERGA